MAEMNKELSFVRDKEYLVCVDSDGCLLDNMELKHKECFCPATVNSWDLQAISKYAREAAEFVNLYSRTRGYNRFPAIIRTLDLLFDREEVKKVGVKKPELAPLEDWIRTSKNLSTTGLTEYCNQCENPDPVLLQAIRWGNEVDANIRHIVRNISPFPMVKESLKVLHGFANIVVVSATPNEALRRELAACGIMEFVDEVAGQEMGTKSENIRKAMAGHYAPDHVLKIGDAVSDYMAACDNHVLFYPIVPGSEVESWTEAGRSVAEAFRAGTYKGEMMDSCVERFLNALPEHAPWEKKSQAEA